MDPEDQIRLLEPLSTKWIQNHAKASRDTVAAWRKGRAPRDDQWRRFIGAYNRWLRGIPDAEEEPPPEWAGAMERKLDVLVAKAGVDPETLDEDETTRLVREALARASSLTQTDDGG